MKYETHEFLQGSTDWLAHRDLCYNGSDIDAARGESPYKTRGKLIHNLATGDKEEVTPEMQQRFDDGHIFEDLARPLAEEEIGEELYPEVLSAVVEGLGRRLSSSLDGKTMSDKINWEHKTLNAALAESLDHGIIPEQYHGQMEQGMLLNGAERCLFSASKWKRAPGNETVEGTIYGYYVMPDETTVRYALVDIKHQWYESNPELRASIIPIWKQIEKEVAEYKPVEFIPAAVAAPTEGFGALVLQVEGRVVACNIDAFRAGASAFLNRLPKPEELNSDQDFANAESAVKACSEAEAKIKAAKDAGLAQMSEVDTVLRVADQIVAEIKAARLALEKSVEIRKASIRSEIVQSGKDRLAEHIGTLNKRLGRVQMPAINADFLAAIKGKRTVESLRNAVDTVLANAKITANDIADKIQINLATLDENKEHAFLFNDVATLVMKAPDDLSNVIKLRIAEHNAEQQRRLDAERERIRAEEQARAQREAAEKAEAERKEQERIAKEAENKAITAEPANSLQIPSNTELPGGQRYSTTTFRDDGVPILLNADGKRSVFCDVDQEASTQHPESYAWKIAGLVAEMTADEQKLVLHYCERIIAQRQESA